MSARITTPASKLGTNQPTDRSSAVDQPFGAEARPFSQVSEVTLDGARANAHELGGVLDGSAAATQAASTSIWRHVALGQSAPRRCPSLMRFVPSQPSATLPASG